MVIRPKSVGVLSVPTPQWKQDPYRPHRVQNSTCPTPWEKLTLSQSMLPPHDEEWVLTAWRTHGVGYQMMVRLLIQDIQRVGRAVISCFVWGEKYQLWSS